MTYYYEDFGLKDVDPTGGRTAINLYDPPGTGKSFTAEAIANELNRNIIRVNYAELESKFVGETPKTLRLSLRRRRNQRLYHSLIIVSTLTSLHASSQGVVNKL